MTRWDTSDKVLALLYGGAGLGLGLLLEYRWTFLFWGPLLLAAAVHLADFRVGLGSHYAWQLFFALFLTQALCVSPLRLLGFPLLAYGLAVLVMGCLWLVREDLYNGGWDTAWVLALTTASAVASLGRLAGGGGWAIVPAALVVVGWLSCQSRLGDLDQRVFGYESQRSSWVWLLRSALLTLLGVLALAFSHAVVCFPGEGPFLAFLTGPYGQQHLLPLLRGADVSGVLEQAWPRAQAAMAACGIFTATLPFGLATLGLTGLWAWSREGAAPISAWRWLTSLAAAVIIGAGAGAPLRGDGLSLQEGLLWWSALAVAVWAMTGRPLAGAVPAASACLAHLCPASAATSPAWVFPVAWLILGALVLSLSPIGLAPAVLASTGRVLVVRDVRPPLEPQWQLVGRRCGNCRGELPGEVARCPHCGVRFGGTSTHYEGGRPTETIEREHATSPEISAGLVGLGWLLPAVLLSAWTLRGLPWQYGEGAVAASAAALLATFHWRSRHLRADEVFRPTGRLILHRVKR